MPSHFSVCSVRARQRYPCLFLLPSARFCCLQAANALILACGGGTAAAKKLLAALLSSNAALPHVAAPSGRNYASNLKQLIQATGNGEVPTPHSRESGGCLTAWPAHSQVPLGRSPCFSASQRRLFSSDDKKGTDEPSEGAAVVDGEPPPPTNPSQLSPAGAKTLQVIDRARCNAQCFQAFQTLLFF